MKKRLFLNGRLDPNQKEKRRITKKTKRRIKAVSPKRRKQFIFGENKNRHRLPKPLRSKSAHQKLIRLNEELQQQLRALLQANHELVQRAKMQQPAILSKSSVTDSSSVKSAKKSPVVEEVLSDDEPKKSSKSSISIQRLRSHSESSKEPEATQSGQNSSSSSNNLRSASSLSLLSSSPQSTSQSSSSKTKPSKQVVLAVTAVTEKEKYDGIKNVHKFIRDFQYKAFQYGWSGEEQAKQIPSHLCGYARTVYENWPAATKESIELTLAKMKTDFAAESCDYLSEFNALKPKHEQSIKEYANELIESLAKAIPNATHDLVSLLVNEKLIASLPEKKQDIIRTTSINAKLPDLIKNIERIKKYELNETDKVEINKVVASDQTLKAMPNSQSYPQYGVLVLAPYIPNQSQNAPFANSSNTHFNQMGARPPRPFNNQYKYNPNRQQGQFRPRFNNRQQKQPQYQHKQQNQKPHQQQYQQQYQQQQSPNQHNQENHNQGRGRGPDEVEEVDELEGGNEYELTGGSS